MNVWLDDKRPMPPGFDVHCLRAPHASKLITVGLVDMISLDHDLGDEGEYGNGYDVARHIERLAEHGRLQRKLTIYLHTANPVGRANMTAAIESAMRYTDRITFAETP